MQENKYPKETLESRPASLTKRFLAFLIDVLLLYLNTFLILRFGLNFEFRGQVITFSIIALILFYFFLFYLIFFNIVLKGQTFGYKIMNIRLISIDGSKPRVWQVIIRSIFVTALAVPFLNQLILYVAISWVVFSIIFLLIPPTKYRKQTFWDLSSKTYVIEANY